MLTMPILPEQLGDYIHAHTTAQSELFEALREETFAKLEYPQMQVGRVEGRFLEMMVKVTGARRVLEVGTFSGYSAMALAAGLPDDGQLITCDLDPVATELAQRYWARCPWGHKIELRLGDARETLAQLRAAGERFDLVFIDADKGGYVTYFEHALEMVPVGGVILVDNTLWGGSVIAPRNDSDHAIVRFNELARDSPRVEQVLLSVRDGIMFCRKLS